MKTILGTSLVMMFLMCGGCIAIIGNSKKPQMSKTSETVPKEAMKTSSQKLYAREELRSMLIGKNPEQVLKLIGKPERTSDLANNRQMWTYYKICYDKITEKTDNTTLVVFENGHVKETN